MQSLRGNLRYAIFGTSKHNREYIFKQLLFKLFDPILCSFFPFPQFLNHVGDVVLKRMQNVEGASNAGCCLIQMRQKITENVLIRNTSTPSMSCSICSSYNAISSFNFTDCWSIVSPGSSLQVHAERERETKQRASYNGGYRVSDGRGGTGRYFVAFFILWDTISSRLVWNSVPLRAVKPITS